MKKFCDVCGKPSGMYPLCNNCFKLRDQGKIIKCEDCGKWHEVDKPCDCIKKNYNNIINKNKTSKDDNISTNFDKILLNNKDFVIEYDNCIVCSEPSNKKPQCLSCYHETLEHMDGLNKNSDSHELRDYYYNLKDVIFRMQDFNIIKENCNKLIAIAMLNEKVNDDTALSSKMYKDVIKLIEEKKPKEEKNVSQKTSDKDEQKTNIHTTSDGHKVKSDMEALIDNMLWEAKILHCYEMPLTMIKEKRKKSDWFIPITGVNYYEGIYIEYWGMDTPKYLKDRAEKEELYKKYNVPYIGIEKDDPRELQSFKNNFIRELREKAEEYFKIMPQWKA